jgi:putative nucleotidyltransferase with HDIG domain
MIKRLIVKLKPIVSSLAEKIEQIEKKINVEQRKKVAEQHEVVLPDLVLVIIFIFSLVLLVGVKNFIVGKVKSVEFVIRLLSLAVVIYFIFLTIFKYLLQKLKNLFNTKFEEYKNSLVLFFTLSLLQVVVIVFFKFNNLTFYLLPITGFVILACLLLDIWWAILFSVFNAVIGGYLFTENLSELSIFSFYYVLVSLYIISLSEKIFSRQDLFFVILKSIISCFLIAVCINLLMYYEIDIMFNLNIELNVFSKEQKLNIFGFLINSIFSNLLSFGLVSVLLSPLELVYKKTTNIKLVELTNLNHPLLKRLMTEAPGTYHHSVMVSSLAEQVAITVSANPLICKVGGLFHDVGKIVHPEYFIENQFAIKNPHSELNPSLSSLVIINHVKEGVKLAYEHKLDKVIIDIIEQHHGNSFIYGLQDKTLEFDFFDKELLRYPGPKPQTKEAAIIMICDSCEAACRSITELDAQKIKQTVERVINAKFVDGQFDEVPFTLRDLYIISDVLTKTLISLYHLRSIPSNGKKG